MGKFHKSIKPAHKDFIEKQHIFFVSTAPLSPDGHVNLSPKGLNEGHGQHFAERDKKNEQDNNEVGWQYGPIGQQ